MATVSDVRGARTGASQEETSPIPLEFMVVSRKRWQSQGHGPRYGQGHRPRQSQDETSPFLLEFEITSPVEQQSLREQRLGEELRGAQPGEEQRLAEKAQSHGGKKRQSQDETSPFLLEFEVVLPDGEAAIVRAAPVPHRSGKALPRLKWRGINASRELREYAARIAAGDELPPFHGPILASGELPSFGPKPTRLIPEKEAQAFLKLALGLMVLSALTVASALLGDDAQLRAAGQSISRWFAGKDDTFETFTPAVPATGTGNELGEPGAFAPSR